eukprot:TRINITY_DN2062_c0_g1_i1.p1 TRINITY_DN2062_c0_g1~~TRINITY_DN2062_c0_g1_i1.p1  ORF type:complete len:262 (-),score=43.31 TRINITY_DN2062_c0_g1_i1:20-805(-)
MKIHQMEQQQRELAERALMAEQRNQYLSSELEKYKTENQQMKYSYNHTLNDSNSQYRSNQNIAGTGNDAKVIIDLSGTPIIVFANNAFCKLFGYPLSEIRGMPWKAFIHSSYLGRTAHILQALEENSTPAVTFYQGYVNSKGEGFMARDLHNIILNEQNKPVADFVTITPVPYEEAQSLGNQLDVFLPPSNTTNGLDLIQYRPTPESDIQETNTNNSIDNLQFDPNYQDQYFQAPFPTENLGMDTDLTEYDGLDDPYFPYL